MRFVALHGDVVAGYRAMVPTVCLFEGQELPAVWARDLYVLPPFRGMGLQRLLDQQVTAASNLRMSFPNELGAKIYAKQGYGLRDITRLRVPLRPGSQRPCREGMRSRSVAPRGRSPGPGLPLSAPRDRGRRLARSADTRSSLSSARRSRCGYDLTESRVLTVALFRGSLPVRTNVLSNRTARQTDSLRRRTVPAIRRLGDSPRFGRVRRLREQGWSRGFVLHHRSRRRGTGRGPR
jgi:hypothetical protein